MKEAEAMMIRYGHPVPVEPHEALMNMLAVASGNCAWLQEAISAMPERELGTPKARTLLALYSEERDRVARIAKWCLDVGVAERSVMAAERYGEAIANILQALFADKDLGLNRKQQALLPELLRRHMLPAGGMLVARASEDDYQEWHTHELLDEIKDRGIAAPRARADLRTDMRSMYIHTLRSDDELAARMDAKDSR